MSAVNLPAEPITGFKTQLTTDGKFCAVHCSGTLDSPDSTTILQPKLLQLHEALVAEAFTLCRLDLSAVTYMNSSAIKCFMAWFLRAERAKVTAYIIEVVYDSQATWQYVSFTTMGRIAPKVLKMVAQPHRATGT
jgi:anti-anti-sigma regulatory factor